MNLPARIHIVGAAGSGKTTLAQALARRTGAPVHDLDRVAYVGGASARRPLDQKLAEVAAIAAQPAWVTEGIYLWWIDDLLRGADLIVWLDPPWRVAAWRIVRRHLLASWRGTNLHPGLVRLWRFVRRQRRYHTNRRPPPAAPDDDGATTRQRTEQALAAYAGKLVRCRSPRDIRRIIR
ncbi:MAG TPA: isopentenyl transferase family protein [Herpetosiphonaceae bacterium]|nr:isopentenyl transferase family protein [Herpetosiphonaceae bacterium]